MTTDKAQNDELYAHVQAEFEKFEETGNGMYLLQAIQQCGLYQLPIPFNVRKAFGDALRRYSEGVTSSIDEAFQVSRPKHAKEPAFITRHRDVGNGYSKGYAIWRKVNELYTPGKKPSKTNVFADVGEIYGLSKETVENIYNEVDAAINQGKNS